MLQILLKARALSIFRILGTKLENLVVGDMWFCCRFGFWKLNYVGLWRLDVLAKLLNSVAAAGLLSCITLARSLQPFFLAKDPTPSKPCSVISRTCQSLGLTLCRWLSGSWSLYTVKRCCLHVRCPLHVSCFNALQRSEGRPVKRGSGRASALKKLAASHVQKKPSTRVEKKPSTRVQKKPSGRVQSMQKKPAKAALLFSGQNAITPFFNIKNNGSNHVRV